MLNIIYWRGVFKYNNNVEIDFLSLAFMITFNYQIKYFTIFYLKILKNQNTLLPIFEGLSSMEKSYLCFLFESLISFFIFITSIFLFFTLNLFGNNDSIFCIFQSKEVIEEFCLIIIWCRQFYMISITFTFVLAYPNFDSIFYLFFIWCVMFRSLHRHQH